MCVVAGSVGAAVAGGLASSAVGSLVGGSGGGGGGGGSGFNSLGQGLGDILSGGLSAALGLQGLAGGNLNQLQAGAAAANPFGQYASGFVPQLQGLLGGAATGIQQQAAGNKQQEMNMLNQLRGSSNIDTGAGTLNWTVGTPMQSGQLANLLNNPTQLIQSLQGGGVQTPAGITALANQDPSKMTAGQQFQYNQGLDAMNRSMAATGQFGSGNQLAAATQYGQQFASQAYQQNVANMLGAQQSINQTSGTNQGLQSLVNQMGQNQFGNTLSLAQLLSGQQQNTINNSLGVQQLLSQQRQNSQTNLQNLLTSMVGIDNNQINANMGLLGPLLTATQASNSSPATAGGILANLGVANQGSAGNVASGIGGLANGIGGLISGLNFGGGGGFGGFGGTGQQSGFYSGSGFGPSGFGTISGGDYYSGGGNTFGFAIPG